MPPKNIREGQVSLFQHFLKIFFVSALFEDIFENAEVSPLKSESQKAAERLLKRLDSEKSVATKNESDKSLIANHVARKFA